MAATAMYFVLLIPDWNSLDSVRRAHSVLEATALVFFALLVLFDVLAHLSTNEKTGRLLEKVGLVFFAVAILAEILAYPYGQRNDTLSAQVIGSLDVKSGQALIKASNALITSGEAETKADAAGNAAGTAQDKAAAVAEKTDRLNGQLLTARAQLDTLDAKRAELEKSLENLAVCTAPRVLPLWLINDPKGVKKSTDPLKPFGGRDAVIEFVPDTEARRAALNLANSLNDAGWRVSTFKAVGGIVDGVDVQPYKVPLDATDSKMWLANMGSEDAADAVVDFLHSYNWEATKGWPMDERGELIRDPRVMPPGSVRIRIGLYPAVSFVAPPGAKEIADAAAKADENTKEHRKAMAKERQTDIAERTAKMTAREANGYKAQLEQWDRDSKASQDRYSSPCQPLRPLVPSLR